MSESQLGLPPPAPPRHSVPPCGVHGGILPLVRPRATLLLAAVILAASTTSTRESAVVSIPNYPCASANRVNSRPPSAPARRESPLAFPSQGPRRRPPAASATPVVRSAPLPCSPPPPLSCPPSGPSPPPVYSRTGGEVAIVALDGILGCADEVAVDGNRNSSSHIAIQRQKKFLLFSVPIDRSYDTKYIRGLQDWVFLQSRFWAYSFGNTTLHYKLDSDSLNGWSRDGGALHL
jgi:hypothetical protein